MPTTVIPSVAPLSGWSALLETGRALRERGSSFDPVNSVAEGLLRTAGAALGGWLEHRGRTEQMNEVERALLGDAPTATRTRGRVVPLPSDARLPLPDDSPRATMGTPERSAAPASPSPSAVTPGPRAAIPVIVDAARAAGVDPAVALTISSIETGGTFDPRIIAGGQRGTPQQATAQGRAYGLGQFMPSTWQEFGLQPTDDPAQQAQGLAAYTARSVQSLRAAGIANPEAWQVYALHLLGPGGGPALLQAAAARPDMPTRDALIQGGYSPQLADAAIRGNSLPPTAGGAAQRLQSVVAQHAQAVAPYAGNTNPATTQVADRDGAGIPASGGISLGPVPGTPIPDAGQRVATSFQAPPTSAGSVSDALITGGPVTPQRTGGLLEGMSPQQQRIVMALARTNPDAAMQVAMTLAMRTPPAPEYRTVGNTLVQTGPNGVRPVFTAPERRQTEYRTVNGQIVAIGPDGTARPVYGEPSAEGSAFGTSLQGRAWGVWNDPNASPRDVEAARVILSAPQYQSVPNPADGTTRLVAVTPTLPPPAAGGASPPPVVSGSPESAASPGSTLPASPYQTQTIPGTERANPQSGEQARSNALAIQGRRQINVLRSLILSGSGETAQMRRDIIAQLQELPIVGPLRLTEEAQRAYTAMATLMEARLRLTTGAAATDSEVRRAVRTFAPNLMTQPAAFEASLNELDQYFRDIARLQGMSSPSSSPTASPVTPPTEQPTRTLRFNPATGALEPAE